MTDSTLPAVDSKRWRNLLLIWQFMTRYPVQVSAACVALIVASGATLAVPYAFRMVVDHGFSAGTVSAINPYFIGLLGIVALLSAATALRFYYVTWLGERVVADIRTATHAHLLTLSPRFFEINRPAEIASRLTADATIIEQIVGSSASIALRNILTAIGGLVLLFTTSPKHAALLLVLIPLIIGPIVLLGRRVRLLSRTAQDRVAQVAAMADETYGGIRIVQAFTQEPRELSRFSDLVERAFQAAKGRIAARALLTAVVIFLIFSGIAAVLWEGARDMIAGNITGGQILSFVLWSALVAGAVGALTEVYGDIMRAMGAAGRLQELLHVKAEIAAPATAIQTLPTPAQGALRFEQVTFAYASKPDHPALSDVSFAVEPGRTVAVVGPSGAGKSTLFGLVCRFYDPQAGRLLLDGVDIRTCDPSDLRQRIALVPQEMTLFATSARENIRYGRPDADDAAIWAAAEDANAAEFLHQLPEGLDTYLGEGGARLSGGQRQRLAIARAVLRNAPILLLDEATSALDAESERQVQTALDRLMQGRTTLVIAHRLATVVRADEILVFDHGHLVGRGAHGELSQQHPLYRRLATLQFNQMAS